MPNNVRRVTSVTPVADPTLFPVSVPSKEPDAIEDPYRLRLIIEATPEGSFIYKIWDRVTGEVVRQLPREEVRKLDSDPTYRQGKVVDTTV